MAYLNVSNNYNNVIYSGGAKSRAILKINDIVVVDLDTPPENIKISNIEKIHNILKVGENRFSLDNFVAQELEIKIYDFDYSLYARQDLQENEYNVIDLSIATLVDDVWEVVPIGIFNIVETPKTDKNITKIIAKCNRIKFDRPYNAQTIIEENEGLVEMGILLQDICNYCGVELGTILPFINSTTKIGVYDNTINANIYVSYIAEKAGSIAVSGRDGKLYLIPINNNLYTHTINKDLIKGNNSFVYGDKFIYDRICYEDGIRKFATPLEVTPNTTIYINAKNPYILEQQEIDNIYDSINGFEIENIKFEMMGNPCIDAWDLITFTNNDIIHKSLANNRLIFNGVLFNKFETSIGKKDTIQENVTIKPSDIQFKRLMIEQDQMNGEISIISSKAETASTLATNTQNNLTNNYTNTNELNEKLSNQENKITKEYTSKITSSADSVKTSIMQEITENGVSKLANTLVTIDIEGLKVAVNTNAFNTLLNNIGLYCRDGNTIVTQIDKDGSILRNPKFFGQINQNDIIIIEEFNHPTFGKGLADFYIGGQ